MSYSHDTEAVREPGNPQSDLVIETKEHGRLALQLSWSWMGNRYEVASFCVTPLDDSTPFLPVMLRRLPLTRIIDTERRTLAEPLRQREPVNKSGVGPDSTRDLTDEDLRYVGELYMEAWNLNLPIQKFVAEKLEIALSTAARRIAIARRRGFISREINTTKKHIKGENP